MCSLISSIISNTFGAQEKRTRGPSIGSRPCTRLTVFRRRVRALHSTILHVATAPKRTEAADIARPAAAVEVVDFEESPEDDRSPRPPPLPLIVLLVILIRGLLLFQLYINRGLCIRPGRWQRRRAHFDGFLLPPHPLKLRLGVADPSQATK
jgi:hypothetical protein